jgi:hypothetical protein
MTWLGDLYDISPIVGIRCSKAFATHESGYTTHLNLPVSESLMQNCKKLVLVSKVLLVLRILSFRLDCRGLDGGKLAAWAKSTEPCWLLLDDCNFHV